MSAIIKYCTNQYIFNSPVSQNSFSSSYIYHSVKPNAKRLSSPCPSDDDHVERFAVIRYQQSIDVFFSFMMLMSLSSLLSQLIVLYVVGRSIYHSIHTTSIIPSNYSKFVTDIRLHALSPPS